jgi:sugar phosphate permease
MKPKEPLAKIRQSRVINASPIYYGWVILFVGSFGIMTTMPGQTVSISVFLDRMIEDLSLSRTTVSLMYTLATFVASFALPLVGRFIDQRGPRIAVTLIAALFALACIYMGFIQGLVMLFIGFVLIRGLGQGALDLLHK